MARTTSPGSPQAVRTGRLGRLGWLAALITAYGCTGQVTDGGPPSVVGRGGTPVDMNGDGISDGIDVNGDGISDGVDTNGDGLIDQPTMPPPGTGGVGAGGNGSSGSSTGGAGSTPDPTAMACAQSNNVLNAGMTKVRRLTRDQFNNTVRDLLGATGTPADALAPDERMGPFASNANAPITILLVEQHQEVATRVANEAKARMAQISPCDLAADTGTTCATQFVTQFGLRAFRRPLVAAEVTDYVNLYGIGKTGGGAPNGFRLVVEAMLQSPFFLYHHDVGGTGAPQRATVPLTPYEFASRLSYFLWNSMPDADLFGRAGDGTLSQDAVINAQVERMLKDPKAGSTIALFHRQWLALDDLPTREKDAQVYPAYNEALVNAMMQETALFTDAVVRNGDGTLKTLLTSNVAYPQGPEFALYGVAQPAGFTPGSPITLNASQRAGILTQPAFLARHAHGNQTAPVQRGIVVRENLLCQSIPSPPMDVNTTPPEPTPATSTRQRFAQHVADPTCASCHSLMDPIGLAFEHYDAIGAYRTTDGMGPVDASGQITAVGPDLAGTFNGAVELANKLAQSRDVADCVANQWFRFSLGRIESTNDACSIQAIREGFRSSGGNIRSLLAQTALSPAFRHVRAIGD